MAIPLIDRNPTPREVEKLRLILSTYQDGTGQLILGVREKWKDESGQTIITVTKKNLPNWRDFERSVAFAFNGEAQESKAIFDVLFPDPARKGIYYGISCKMRGTLNDTFKTGRVTLELSNAWAKFWTELERYGFNQKNYSKKPEDVARIILGLYKSWHESVGVDKGGTVDLDKSYYLALSWNKAGSYQLHKFSLRLPNVESLAWRFPSQGRRLVGYDGAEKVFEWYGQSGGQLKYYPLAEQALWKSEPFQLESIGDVRYGVLHKAEAYFPELWAEACRPERV